MFVRRLPSNFGESKKTTSTYRFGGRECKMTQTSAALKEVKANGRVRMQTVRCGLKKAVRSEGLSDVFRDFAVRVGAVRHVVSLVANALIIRHGATNIESWYKWYNNIWSAVDYVVEPSGMKSTNPHIGEVRSILDEFPDLLSNLRTSVPERCPCMLRVKECFEMGTATEQHLGSFSDRLEAFVTVRVVELLAENNDSTASTKDVIVSIKHFILADPEKADTSKLLEKLKTAKVTKPNARNALVGWAQEERTLLDELVQSSKSKERWFYVVKCKSQCWKLVTHLARYSTYMAHELRNDRLLLERLQEQSNESGVPMVDLIRRHRKWSRILKPRPFSILPIYKLQACLVYYGYTEVKELYSFIHAAEMRKYIETHPKPSRKRKTAENSGSEAFDEAMRTWESKAPQRFDPNPSEFAKTIFRDKLPISTNVGQQKIVCFRTDGVKLCITFASNDTPISGVEELVDKGYLSVPICEDVDVSVEKCGLWHLTQNNGGTIKCSTPVDICCVDPGLHKPVEWSSMKSNVKPNCSDVVKAATLDFVSEDTWMRLSGRGESNVWEKRRRAANPEYGEALEALSTTMRHSADYETFREYLAVCGQTLTVRFDELCHRRRSLRSWLSDRRSQSFLSRMANRIANQESVKIRTTTSAYTKAMSPQELEELRKRAKAARIRRKDSKTVVFFGDGEFNHAMRHHVSIPKKSILHELGTRVPTILIDEYSTSKKCVCGASLCNQTDETACRVRVHQDGGDCEALRCGICDRDELATLNIAMASLTCIARQPWPVHLQRKS